MGRSDNVINFSFIDYIIKSYVPELQSDKQLYGKIRMGIFREAMLHQTTKVTDVDKTYERLEYLGDAIFHMIITDYLYHRYDDQTEGFLTRLRIRIERGDSMADLAKKLELDLFIQISGIYLSEDILEDVFEAFLGAFYLNFGMAYTRTFIIRLIEKHKDLSELIYYDDNYKDLLLRYFHQVKWGHPKYVKTVVNGKFVSTVRDINQKKIGVGIAANKKKAEQLASKDALCHLNVIVDGEIDNDWLDKIDKVEKEEKERIEKKPLPIGNPYNKLLKKSDIMELLDNYNVKLNKDQKINIKLFCEAMTHRSYLKHRNKNNQKMENECVKLQDKSNDRLRFLGDTIIHFIIGEYLFNKYQNKDEGFLTRLRCKLENRESLFYLANQSGISSYVLISQTIEVLHGRTNVNIIGRGFEAFIGALYLDAGLNKTQELVLSIIRTELDVDRIAEKETNYKDLIIHLYIENHWGRPVYRLLGTEGPDHCKIFTIGIYLNDKLMGIGKASSKRKAEQIASKKMYNRCVKKQLKISNVE